MARGQIFSPDNRGASGGSACKLCIINYSSSLANLLPGGKVAESSARGAPAAGLTPFFNHKKGS